jgi:hypothetical protein
LDKYEGKTSTATELVGGKKTEKASKETRIWIIQRAWLRGNGDKDRQRGRINGTRGRVEKRIRVADLEIVSVYDAEGASEETWQV